MLGGGNPVGGNNPGGIGQTLHYVGNFAYGYSGTVSVNNNETSLLKFSTGATVITAEVLMNYAEDAAFTEDYVFKIKVDGDIIMMFLYDGAKLDNPPQPIPLIVAPFAEVEVTAINITNTNARTVAAMVTGKVHQ
jgi:hypothetical protein